MDNLGIALRDNTPYIQYTSLRPMKDQIYPHRGNSMLYVVSLLPLILTVLAAHYIHLGC